MDEDRRIRFLVAPTLFIASLLWGAWSDDGWRYGMVAIFKNPDWPQVIGTIAGGGLAVFVGGYVIGTWTHFVLRIIFQLRPERWGKSRFHEVAMSDGMFERVWERVGNGNPDRSQELFAGVAFDHGVIREKHKGIHEWLVRRWNGFNIAASSFWAIVFSISFGLAIGVPISPAWGVPAILLAGILLCVMCWSWRDTMGMLEFMAASTLCQ
jgi:hypothetical protein